MEGRFKILNTSHRTGNTPINTGQADSLPGPDYFDEAAKCYGRLFEFCQVTFCYSRQWGRMTLAKF